MGEQTSRALISKGPLEAENGRGDFAGWSIYLGTSWTWCIGMFLPVLLIRDYGLWGFVAFAVPNVVGAAAMGWVIRSSEQSRRFVVDHSLACAAFSFVTICFHGFFLGWISTRLLGRADLIAVVFALLAFGMLLLMRWADGFERWLAIAVALVSWCVFVFVVRYRLDLGIFLPDSPPGQPADIAALAAVCILGFALCPYLDRTFHLARPRVSPRSAKLAFGLGFGVVFSSMIVFTLIYADLILVPRVSRTVALLLLTHLVVQSAFTVAAHGAQVRRLVGAIFMYVAAAVMFAGGCWSDRIAYDHTSGGELGYRLFMAFYGLVAPAYMWICALRQGRPNRAALVVFVLTVVAAVPFYWLAFIEHRMPWVLAGVGLVILGRLLADAAAPRNKTASGSA